MSSDCLKRIFPKLTNLTHLRLWYINYWHSLPSQHLEELKIFDNDAITDRDLEAIDSQSPKLRIIKLGNQCLIESSAVK